MERKNINKCRETCGLHLSCCDLHSLMAINMQSSSFYPGCMIRYLKKKRILSSATPIPYSKLFGWKLVLIITWHRNSVYEILIWMRKRHCRSLFIAIGQSSLYRFTLCVECMSKAQRTWCELLFELLYDVGLENTFSWTFTLYWSE